MRVVIFWIVGVSVECQSVKSDEVREQYCILFKCTWIHGIIIFNIKVIESIEPLQLELIYNPNVSRQFESAYSQWKYSVNLLQCNLKINVVLWPPF